MGLIDINCCSEYEKFEQHCLTPGNLNCKYYNPEDIVKITHDFIFSLMHLNIRSLKKHHEDLVSLLACIGHNFDIIGCSETWLNGHTYLDIYNLNGYSLYYKNRLGKIGGGVCLYVNSQYSVKERTDIKLDDGYSDSLFLELKNINAKSIIIGVIYRPPDSDYATFRDQLDGVLFCINQTNTNCLIMGDFNIDISKEDTIGTDFINTLHSSSFFPTINKHTRITERSQSTLENIITNMQGIEYKSGVVYSDITDHYPIIQCMNLNKNVPNLCTRRKVKVLSHKSLANLTQHLQTKRWDAVFNTTDPDCAYNSLISEINDSIDKTIPEKIIKQNAIQPKPWITNGILKSIRKKNTLYKKYIKNLNIHNKSVYTKYKNKLTKVLRASKQLFYCSI